ncbi:hypothetical protein [Agromyces humi]|uniref:hypothetical protein n=1 Tax=Agromyces humi TaxID=1766800 RepID=UPI001F406ABA|nr:hypothetical protein [Agromyces humi]
MPAEPERPARQWWDSRNGWAIAAALVAIISLFINPFLIFGIVAIILGAVGVGMAGSAGYGRAQAIGAMSVGALATAWSAYQLFQAMS